MTSRVSSESGYRGSTHRMRHNERRHTHQHHHSPAPALDNAHGIPRRRQRRVSDVSGLLFASDFPKFGEEPNSGMKAD